MRRGNFAKSNKPQGKPIMPSKKNPTTIQQLNLKAQDLHKLIGENENTAAPIYWTLGATLREIRKAGNLSWQALLKHCDSIGLRRSRVTRALRVRKRHSTIQACKGTTLYEALGNKKSVRKPLVQQPVEAPLSDPERKAVERLEKVMGGPKRFAQVLKMFFAERQSTVAPEPTVVPEPSKVSEPTVVPEPVVAPESINLVGKKNKGHRSAKGEAPKVLPIDGSIVPDQPK